MLKSLQSIKKEKVQATFKKWLRKKRTYALLALVVLILFTLLKPKDNPNVSLDTVKMQDLQSTVSATGVVTSTTDLSLSFNAPGVVRTMKVKVGDEVKKGAILASLDSGSAYGALLSAQGSLRAAEARYKKTIEGATSEEITIATVALANAVRDFNNTILTQNNLVENAHRALLSSGLAAKSSSSNSSTVPTISGTYAGTNEGKYIISLYSSGDGAHFSLSGLEAGGGLVNTTTAVPLGTRGLFIQFPSEYVPSSGSSFVVDVPNTEGTSYVTNFNAYQSALKTRESTTGSAQALVDQRQAELSLKRAAARPADLDLARADVLSAQGQVATASAAYENTIIRAPENGTITMVNVKPGELAEAGKEALVLQDVENIYIKAPINEANITRIKLDQPVSFTIDAFGPDRTFSGAVMQIDPGATTNEGIVNYQIEVSITDMDPAIRTDMNANLTILLADYKNVLVVPALALTHHDGKTFVNSVTKAKRKKYIEKEVTTGEMGDGNLVIVQSGVAAGDPIAIVTSSPQ